MISVIVPVYNVEVYLPRCLDSILAQTYEDYEVLLIDDGSTDNSGQICDQYAERDLRIHVFHKKNGGLSDARNYGLERMKGQFVTFVDSDDYIGKDYLRILAEMQSENDANVSVISMQDTWSSETTYVESEDGRSLYLREDAFREMLAGSHIGVMACGKLFRSDMFDEIRFPYGKVYEDLATIPFVICKTNKCVVSSSKQYYYYQRTDSLSNRVSVRQIDDWIETIERLLSFTQETFPNLYPYAETRLVRTTFWWILDRLLQDREYIPVAKRFKKMWRPHFVKVWSLPRLTIKERFKVTVFMVSIRLFRMVRLPMIKVKAGLR